MSPFEVGILGCGLLVGLIAVRVPVAFASLAAGLIGYFLLLEPGSALSYVASDLWSQFNTFAFSCVPMFILMGYFAAASGITDKLFESAYVWMGRLRGGLAMATIAACGLFAAVSSSGPATAATIGKIAYPQMKKFGYDSGLATGAIAAGGTLGPLIPPSGAMIVYAIVTEQSIIKCLLAGIIPGILITTLMAIVTHIRCRRKPELGPPGPKTTVRQKIRALPGILETVVLFGFVIGGMYAGWFTPTQGGAAGAFAALVMAFVQLWRKSSRKTRKRARAQGITVAEAALVSADIEEGFRPKVIWTAAKEATALSCMVLFLIAGSVVFGHLLSLSTFTQTAVTGMQNLPFSPVVVIIIICIFYIIGGCFVDSLGLLVLTTPIIAPVISGLGYDLVWWGAVMCILGELGAITPPFGVNVFVVKHVAGDVSLNTIFRGILPFFLAILVGLAIVIAFPSVVTWLPSLSSAGG